MSPTKTSYTRTDEWLLRSSTKATASAQPELSSVPHSPTLTPEGTRRTRSYARDEYRSPFASPAREPGGGSATSSYRSPYRGMQSVFFRGGAKPATTAGTAAAPLDAPPPATPSTPVRGAEATYRSQILGEDVTEQDVTARTSEPYVSPFRSTVPPPVASPHGSVASLSGAAARPSASTYSSLAVASHTSMWRRNRTVLGGGGPAVGSGDAARQEREEREAYAQRRDEERRRKHATEQEKRTKELEEAIFGADSKGRDGGGSRSSLRVKPQASPSVPARLGLSHSTRVTPVRRAPASSSGGSVREAAAAAQRLDVQQRTSPVPLKIVPQPEPEPEPEPVTDWQASAASTPPGPPPASERAGSPPAISAFTVVEEGSGSTTPLGPPPPLDGEDADDTDRRSAYQQQPLLTLALCEILPGFVTMADSRPGCVRSRAPDGCGGGGGARQRPEAGAGRSEREAGQAHRWAGDVGAHEILALAVDRSRSSTTLR